MSRSIDSIIDDYLKQGPYAVIGASKDLAKYGNKVLRAYQQRGANVFAVNPSATEIEGQIAYPDLSSLPETPRGISIITPPRVTETVITEAVALGIAFAWIQPGAESPSAIDLAEAGGMEVIADGSCFLVVSGYHE
jgi:predicted CoA-binding protein